MDVKEEITRVELKDAQDKYRKAVSVAVGEVENTILNLKKYQEQRDLEKVRLDRLLEAQKKSNIRLENGLITQLELLNYQQQVLVSRQDVLNLNLLILSDTITLYNALGGPWIPR